MKRKKLFLLYDSILANRYFACSGTGKIRCSPCQLERDLADVLYVSGTPQVPGELKPSNSF